MFAKKRKMIGIYILFVLVFMSVMAYRLLFFQSPVIERAYSYIVYPILHVQAMLIGSIDQWAQRAKDAEQLRIELHRIQHQYEDLQAENVALHSKARYTQDTEQLRAYNEEHHIKEGHIAQILMRIFSPSEHYFLVDAGLNHAIKKDMVAVYKNCLVGRVEHVYPWYSKVRLITDSACKVAACCVQSNAMGIHQGCNSLEKTTLNYISHLSEISSNDLLISSGQGLVFPRGYGLGVVESYKKDDLHYTVTIKPIINLRQLSYCTILAKGDEIKD